MRTLWCCSYFSFRPRRIEIVSSTDGSSTKTGWKRRASAASFSTCLRYSSSVVAPTQCSSPRASAGFSRLDASIAPSRLAGADQRVHLVDEQDDAAVGRRDLVEHRLQPLLELAAIFRAGNQRAHVERHQLLVLQRLRHVAIDDAQRQPFGDGRLADAGLADQHRIVLGAARQHLDGAADFVVAADHRIELALARIRGQVARVLLQRVIALLGARRIGGAALADVVDRRCSAPAAVTPALARISAVLADFSTASAVSSRSTVTKLSPAFLAISSAVEKTFASGCDR